MGGVTQEDVVENDKIGAHASHIYHAFLYTIHVSPLWMSGSLKFRSSNRMITPVLVMLVTMVTIFVILVSMETTEGFASNDYTTEPEHQAQVALLAKTFRPFASAKRPVSNLVASNGMPVDQQCLVNFFALGCRYTGYIGPMKNGYMSPDIAVQSAVQAGCRVFVLDIDYLDDCGTPYMPRIVVRDSQNKLQIRRSSDLPLCPTADQSNLRTVCEKINYYAFSDECQQSTDPIVIVLYFLRQPPGSSTSLTVLNYFSEVAKALAPFQNRLLNNELEGGSFYRQKQESRLLINKITDYKGRVLVFSNANTSGFREVNTFSPMEDLDYLVNLRLTYTQTALGITQNASSSFGILDTAESFTVIPADRVEDVAQNTKMRWTICLPNDPMTPVSKETFTKITTQFGVHCVPMTIFDPHPHLFTEALFKTYGFAAKPPPLRYIKPPVVVPGVPNVSTDAKGGKLRAPTM